MENDPTPPPIAPQIVPPLITPRVLRRKPRFRYWGLLVAFIIGGICGTQINSCHNPTSSEYIIPQSSNMTPKEAKTEFLTIAKRMQSERVYKYILLHVNLLESRGLKWGQIDKAMWEADLTPETRVAYHRYRSAMVAAGK